MKVYSRHKTATDTAYQSNNTPIFDVEPPEDVEALLEPTLLAVASMWLSSQYPEQYPLGFYERD